MTLPKKHDLRDKIVSFFDKKINFKEALYTYQISMLILLSITEELPNILGYQ